MPAHSLPVSRSLAACQGAVLLVDATQGVQAQTSANFFLAFEQNLTIIPALNKIDMPSANVDKFAKQIEASFDLPASSHLHISAKTGLNCTSVRFTARPAPRLFWPICIYNYLKPP